MLNNDYITLHDIIYFDIVVFILTHSIHILQNVFFLNPQKWTNLQFKTLGLN
jgi:K+-transporting ATPase A subunit